MSAEDRQARENLVTSLVAGIAVASGADAATATGAGQIEVENNQLAIPMASPPAWLAGFKLPGFTGQSRGKDDGIIADPATELDPSMKAGPLVSPLPDAKTIGDWITSIIPDQAKDLADYVLTMAGWKRGDDVYQPTASNNDPSWSAVRSRFWKNEAQSPGAAEKYGAENLDRMSNGLAPQRYNPDKGGMESMELSHEPVPARDGGTEFVPRWPQDHATVDPFRRPGY
jgi:filamentous hemagglutinin